MADGNLCVQSINPDLCGHGFMLPDCSGTPS